MNQKQTLAILKSGANVFLTGEPGSGKTHTVNVYIGYLRQHGIEPAVTASTGIAATHLHGQTIHSWAGLGVRENLTKQDLVRLAGNERLEKRLKRTNVLIVDEISMLAARQLDMVDTVCRHIKKSNDAFGGLQIILVGDFFQLPPINRPGNMAQFAFQSQAWQTAQLVVCYLNEQHRQNDARFLDLLTAIRRRQLTDKHYQSLNDRQISNHNSNIDLPRLYAHNVDVDRLNQEKLSKLSGKPRTFSMTAGGPAVLVEALKRGCLSPENLELKVGAAVMFTKNNPANRFVNGTLGQIVGFENADQSPIVKTRDNKKIVAKPMEWTIEEHGRARARIAQVPLRLAWAITIHKSQGMSMDAAVMDLSSVFEFGQGYVALSRLRSFEGLHLLGWNERALEIHPEIFEYDLAFQQASIAALEQFSQISSEQLAELCGDFIVRAGGSLKPTGEKKSTKPDTYETTLQLIKQKLSIAEISRHREMAVSTIVSHLEELRSRRKLSHLDLAYLVIENEQFTRLFPEISSAFVALGREKLKPVYEHFSGKHNYDTLRLARLLLK